MNGTRPQSDCKCSYLLAKLVFCDLTRSPLQISLSASSVAFLLQCIQAYSYELFCWLSATSEQQNFRNYHWLLPVTLALLLLALLRERWQGSEQKLTHLQHYQGSQLPECHAVSKNAMNVGHRRPTDSIPVWLVESASAEHWHLRHTNILMPVL